MSRLVRQRGWRWTPDHLGRSLPIAHHLWLSRGIGLAIFLLGIALLAWLRHAMLHPDVDTPLSARDANTEVFERLATVRLLGPEAAPEPWDPGAQLGASELPPYVPSPEPTIWSASGGRHPGDPPPDSTEARDALRTLDARPVAAATLFERAVRSSPSSWVLRYHTGLAFFRTRSFDKADTYFVEAQKVLPGYALSHGELPLHHESAILSRYAAGLANRTRDCLQSIAHLKRAGGAMKSYVDVGGALVPDRRWPFRLEASGLTNYDVWNALIASYDTCEEKFGNGYQTAYSEEFPGSKTFRKSEYSEPDDPEIVEGLFPAELAECVRTDGATARCWALSNSNHLYSAIRHFLDVEDDAVPLAEFSDTHASVVRFLYNSVRLTAAPLGAQEPGSGTLPESVNRLLEQMERLAKASETDLGEEIFALGRYLAPVTRDYSMLARRYRQTPDNLVFSADQHPEEVKGIAWSLLERWQDHLEDFRPQAVFEEVEAVIRKLPEDRIAGLRSWRDQLRKRLVEVLEDGIREERRRGNLARAVALRDFRAEYLGTGWSDRARASWLTLGDHLRLAATAGFFALLFATWLVIHRRVVYPYLMYTRDYYKTEFHRRHKERKAAKKPFIGREIAKKLRID